jgi:hypothetical protein
MSNEPLNSRMEPTDSPFMHMIVRRREVETCDVEPTLKVLQFLLSDNETALRFQNHVALSFQGYDDDPRGLFQIVEVCEFVRNLNGKWCAWFFFMTKDLNVSPLAVIALCCCRYTVSPMRLFIPQIDDLKKFLWDQFGALRGYCGGYNLPQERTEAEVQAVIDYLTKVGFVGGCDLPRLDIDSAKTGKMIELMRIAGK